MDDSSASLPGLACFMGDDKAGGLADMLAHCHDQPLGVASDSQIDNFLVQSTNEYSHIFNWPVALLRQRECRQLSGVR